MVHWRNHISVDNGILLGKPHINNTRLSVEFILERLADGWTEEEILENYPRLRKLDLMAVYSYINVS